MYYSLGSKISQTMDKLGQEFSELIINVAKILNESPDNVEKLKLICNTITPPEKSLLFSPQKSSEIRESTTVLDIFYHLRGHWRWDSHLLLFTLIKRTNSPEALEKVEQFQQKINYTKKLSEFSSSFKSVYKYPPPGYAKMIAIVKKNYTEYTLDDCRELNDYLASFFGSLTLIPPEIENFNSIRITWYIPSKIVSNILSAAHQIKELFQLLSISLFEIGEIVIWNEKKSNLPQVRKL